MKKTALTLGRGALLGLGAMALLTGAALAQGTPPAAKAPDLVVNKGDDAWMLISSALVLLMTIPGLALFYGGMVRTKNMLSMITQVTVIFCLSLIHI